MSKGAGKGNNKPSHTQKTVEAVMSMQPGDFNALSVEFAKTCVQVKVSPADVSKVLGVTRGAVHQWMKGRKIKEERRPLVRKLIDRFREDLDAGSLPKPTRTETSSYMGSLRESI